MFYNVFVTNSTWHIVGILGLYVHLRNDVYLFVLNMCLLTFCTLLYLSLSFPEGIFQRQNIPLVQKKPTKKTQLPPFMKNSSVSWNLRTSSGILWWYSVSNVHFNRTHQYYIQSESEIYMFMVYMSLA
jgi:hypothetical protein